MVKQGFFILYFSEFIVNDVLFLIFSKKRLFRIVARMVENHIFAFGFLEARVLASDIF